jgi:hypothetical protein
MMMKKIYYRACLLTLFAIQSAYAEIPVTMSGPSPAIGGNATAGSSNTYTYTIVNNVPKSFPITVSGISGPISRVMNSGNDCASSLPPGPSTCTIQVSIAPTTSNGGQTFNQVLSVDYQGRYPLVGNINFTVTSATPPAGCAGAGGNCRVFLSTTTTEGDISGATALVGPAATTCSQPGVTGNPFTVANCICNYDATHVQGITGANFHAWLSTTTLFAPTNISYDPTLTYTSIMPNGAIIADPANLLTSGNLLSAIVPNATLSDFAYTGSNPNGTPETGYTCSDWTTSSMFKDGAAGRQVGTDSSWTLWSNEGCDSSHNLYCFEVP